MVDLINISIQYGGKSLFENVNYRINKTDKIALVGANGTGKSTLLKIIKGLEPSETGYIEKSKKTKIGYLQQEFINIKGKPLFEEVKLSLTEISELELSEKEITSQLNMPHITEDEKISLINQLGVINHRKEEIGYYEVESNIEKVLMGLGFNTIDFHRLTDEFSGGWQMRIELAKILLNSNDLIMLDEPTNHLDLDTLRWLVNYLINFKGAILLVSHDKYFVNQITNKTIEIFNRKLNPYNGKYDDYFNYKEERDRILELEYINQQKKIKDTEKFIEKFRYKATKAKQVQSRIKQLEKIDLVELINQDKKIKLRFPEPIRTGAIPISLTNVTKSYDTKVIFNKLDFSIQRDEKIALVGPNGAGKTTLSKIIAQKLNIDSGNIEIGHNTEISYYAQEVAENLNPEYDILESVAEIGVDLTLPQLRTLLGFFLFSDDDVFKKVKILSGGEKSRVALAKILLTRANLIILDEPTNHLDFSSKEILQQALMEFSGSLVLVSHDIDFLRPIVNRVVEIRPGIIKNYPGGIDYYLEKSAQQNIENKISEKVDASKNIKKDQKRIEAEIRQKKYKATKDIVKEIEKIELSISEFENKIKNIEIDLGKEEVFTNPTLSKEKNIEYETSKKKLDYLLSQWTEFSTKLEEIENSFNLE